MGFTKHPLQLDLRKERNGSPYSRVDGGWGRANRSETKPEELTVDDARFDRWTRTLGTPRSRRGALAALAGSAAAIVGWRRVAAQTDGPGLACGGLMGLPCPDGYVCIDDSKDSCDPATGGADCIGVCVLQTDNPCIAMTCLEGTTCCPLCGGVCLPSDVACSEDVCAGQPCNQVTCGAGEYCCNESCSLCAPVGAMCIELYCEPDSQGGVPCGKTTCPPGQVCCNESCGICTPPGGMCIALFCTD